LQFALLFASLLLACVSSPVSGAASATQANVLLRILALDKKRKGKEEKNEK
jgi:hypothetical protein